MCIYIYIYIYIYILNFKENDKILKENRILRFASICEIKIFFGKRHIV